MRKSLTSIDLASRESAVIGLRVFFNIAREWELAEHEQTALLGVSQATLDQWRQDDIEPLDRDKVERLSYILGIYKALQILFPSTERHVRWLRAPNSAPLFNGRTALDRMTAGRVSDLYVVRQYLDSHLG